MAKYHIDRETAARSGHTFYLGYRCPSGHSIQDTHWLSGCLRYVSNNQCVECSRERKRQANRRFRELQRQAQEGSNG